MTACQRGSCQDSQPLGVVLGVRRGKASGAERRDRSVPGPVAVPCALRPTGTAESPQTPSCSCLHPVVIKAMT